MIKRKSHVVFGYLCVFLKSSDHGVVKNYQSGPVLSVRHLLILPWYLHKILDVNHSDRGCAQGFCNDQLLHDHFRFGNDHSMIISMIISTKWSCIWKITLTTIINDRLLQDTLVWGPMTRDDDGGESSLRWCHRQRSPAGEILKFHHPKYLDSL